MRTTDRHTQIVSWIGRIGAAGAQHVSERFDLSRGRGYVLLAELTADGWLEHRRVLYGWPGVYTATRRGLRRGGLVGLPVFQASPGGFEHAWEMASTAVALNRWLPGWELLAERELGRLQDEDRQVVARARVGSVGAREAYHRPDFALISPSRRVVVVEVELTPKGMRQLVRICRGWTRARHVEHVYYLATASAGAVVRRAIEAVHAEDVISVLARDDVSGLAERELQIAGSPLTGEHVRQVASPIGEEVSDVSA